MSFESQLTILRTLNDKNTIDKKQITQIKTEFKNSYKDLLFGTQKEMHIPNFLSTEIDDDKEFISLKDNKLYLNIVSTHFCSDFTILKDYYNLNQYTGYNQVELDKSTVEDMVRSINYILNFKHSEELEQLLNSKWIELFGELLPSFINRFETKCKNCLSNEDKEFEYFGKHLLNRVKIIFETYLLLLDEDQCNQYKYVLLYYI